MALADRHEQTISADEIVFLADLDMLVIIDAVVLEPDRIAGALIAPGDRPRPCQGMVISGDLSVQNVGVGAVEIEALLE